jgi:hypothetical protein
MARQLLNDALDFSFKSRAKPRSRAAPRDLYDVRLYSRFLWRKHNLCNCLFSDIC